MENGRAVGTPCPQNASEEGGGGVAAEKEGGREGEARMRGEDEQCGVARKEVSKPVEIG